MRIEIVDNDVSSAATGQSYGRIQEIVEGEDVTTCFICDNEATINKEAEVRYCCQEHKELHQPPDQDEAYPFVVKYRPDIGRYMVASRDIQPGELIFAEEPLAVGPNHTSLPCCLDCMNQVTGHYLCPKCNLPVCEEMCAYGEEHSKECPIFAGLSDKVEVKDYSQPDTLYWCITVIRALVLRDTDPHKYDMIRRMMDHNSEHEQKQEMWDMYKENVVDYLRVKCGLADRFSAQEIFHVLGALDVNSVKIHTNSTTSWAGHGLYGLTALLSHSCISNSKTILRADYANECRATIVIPKGEEITKQYVSPLETTSMRRQKLKQGWYFDCKCVRCVDPTESDSFVSATRCMRCGEGTILPLDPVKTDPKSVWKCEKCGFNTNQGAVDNLVQYFTDKLANPTIFNSVEALEDLLEKSARLLHPHNYAVNLIRIKMNIAYINLAYRMFGEEEHHEQKEIPVEVYMRRKDLLDDIHKVIDIVDPGLTRRRGLSLFEMSTCHLQLGRLLYESQRFPLDDFMQLLNNEMASLNDALLCLQDSREGTNDAVVHYRANCALHEAKVMLRLLQQKSQEPQQQQQRQQRETDQTDKQPTQS